jgi:hypothetical protein
MAAGIETCQQLTGPETFPPTIPTFPACPTPPGAPPPIKIPSFKKTWLTNPQPYITFLVIITDLVIFCKLAETPFIIDS